MAKVVGIEGMTGHQLHAELQSGARFVVFQYCVSLVVITFRRGSDIYYIRPGENAVSKGLFFSFISLILGWWGIPWGPIFTIGSLVTNFRGGKDVTSGVVSSLNRSGVPTPPDA